MSIDIIASASHSMRAHRALRLPLEALMAHAKDGSGSRLIVATSSVVPLGPTSLVPSHSLPWQMEKHRMCRSAAM